jgi:hypothetical protein
MQGRIAQDTDENTERNRRERQDDHDFHEGRLTPVNRDVGNPHDVNGVLSSAAKSRPS